MSEEVALRIGGANVFWSLGTSQRAMIVSAFEAHGVKDYCPEPKTPEACLRHALATGITPEKGCKVVVRPLEDKDKRGFAVHTMPKKCPDDCTDGRAIHVVTATLPTEGDEFEPSAITFLPSPDSKIVDAVSEEFNAAKHTFSVSAVGGALVKIVEDHLHGVTLKPKGHIYWIDKAYLPIWRFLATAIEACVVKDAESNIYAMPVIAGEEMVRAVGDALTNEINSEVARMEADVTSTEMTERVTERHVKKASALQKKVANYAECFGKPLTELQDMLQRAVSASAMATLKASAAGVASSMSLMQAAA